MQKRIKAQIKVMNEYLNDLASRWDILKDPASYDAALVIGTYYAVLADKTFLESLLPKKKKNAKPKRKR